MFSRHSHQSKIVLHNGLFHKSYSINLKVIFYKDLNLHFLKFPTIQGFSIFYFEQLSIFFFFFNFWIFLLFQYKICRNPTDQIHLYLHIKKISKTEKLGALTIIGKKSVSVDIKKRTFCCGKKLMSRNSKNCCLEKWKGAQKIIDKINLNI